MAPERESGVKFKKGTSVFGITTPVTVCESAIYGNNIEMKKKVVLRKKNFIRNNLSYYYRG
jgi:hypothetical protein